MPEAALPAPSGADATRAFKIDQQAAVRYCAEGFRALENGQAEAAKCCAIDALMARPSCFQAYQLLGKYFDTIKKPDEAEQCFSGVLPRSIAARYFPRTAPPNARVGLAELNGSANNSLSLACVSVTRIPVQPTHRSVFSEPSRMLPQVDSAGQSISSRSQLAEIVSESCFVDVIANGVVWHDALNTLVLDAEGKVLSDHSTGCDAVLHTLRDGIDPCFTGGRAILLGARGAHNFYHWSVDIIPKLGLLKMAGLQMQSDDIYIVPFARSGFMIELLARFGISPDQLVQSEDISPYLCADELIVPRMCNRMGLGMGTWLPVFMREAMVEKCHPPQPPVRKLFISRHANRADGRAINNRQEVEACFRSYGFEIVLPEELSVLAQASTFSQASVVAGVHGAGLTNLLYCSPGTKVIEFYGAHFAPCYQAICALSGLEYYSADFSTAVDAVAGNETGGAALRSRSARRSASLHIPIDSVESLLEIANIEN